MQTRQLSAIQAIVVHHSASSIHTSADEIHRWHVIERGWDAIGYHALIDARGVATIGRRLDQVGAHCRGHNLTTLGVCLVGNNLEPANRWTAAQKDALRDWLGFVQDELGRELVIVRHRDLAPTECPGLDDAAWTDLLNEVT